MRTRKCEVAIVGAGSAGLSALDEVRKRTEDYLLIDGGPLGSSCARVACMPTKTLIEAANGFHRRLFAARVGVRGGEAAVADIPAVLRYVREKRDYFVAGMVDYTREQGERFIEGRARFVAANVLEAGGLRIEADKVVIATGSRPVYPAAWEPCRSWLLTTDELFEQEDLPPTMAVIGLGPAGLELAQALGRLGLAVTGIDAAAMVGGISDPRVNAAAVAALGRELPLFLERRVALSPAGGLVRIDLGDRVLEVGRILVATGRRPNLDGLGLEETGAQLDGRGIPLYNPRTLQVGNLPIFLTGDANGDRAILHEAIDEGLIAGFNAVSPEIHCFQRRTPLAIAFTEPNLATVGSRFSDLAPAGVAIGEYDFGKQSRALMSGDNAGLLRVYVDRGRGVLTGAELAAPAGEHLAQMLAWAVQAEMTVDQLLAMPWYHPVVAEGLRSALGGAARELGRDFAVGDLLCAAAPQKCLG